MRPIRCDLLRLRIPFHGRFVHARSGRAESDTLLVLLTDAAGRIGFGEILPRAYVTGEDLDTCLEALAPELAATVLGREFGDQDALARWIAARLEEGRWSPALFGGFESALLDLHAQAHGLDYAALLGPPRRTATGSCATLGFETPIDALPRFARAVKIGGATAVKLKVGGVEDAARVIALARALHGDIALRLDANGSLTVEDALSLLAQVGGVSIHSLEQPLAPDEPDLVAKLRELHARSGVELMADESVCTIQDARQWIDSGGYQWVNVRVGKSGGLLAAAAIASLAARRGIGLVCGTMVGETAVLDRASQRLLAHTESLPYAEGLGQHRFLLSVSPVRRIGAGAGEGAFTLDPEIIEQCLVTRRTIGGRFTHPPVGASR